MKRIRTGLLLLTALWLSSCALLPEEESVRTAPVVRAAQAEVYQYAYVTRGDLTLSRKVACTYVPVKSQALSFAAGGEYIDEAYVSAGDAVKAGDVLASLRLDGVQDKIDACALEIAKLKLSLTQIEEDRALTLERLRIQYASDPGALSKALEGANAACDGRMQTARDTLSIREMRLAELTRDRNDRLIVAPFDGTVTYVRSFRTGDRSTRGERFITVADSTLSLFRAETEYWDRFHEGDAYPIAVGKKTYDAVVASEASLSLPEQEKTIGEKAYVYLMLTQPAFELEDGDRGSMEILFEERKDVLLAPKSAFTTANGEAIVYYLTDEGIRSYKTVQTGLEANNMVEITGGLTEGEQVIVG